MNVAVIGSRTITDYEYIKYVLDKYREKYTISKIVSGGARGVDSLAAKYANENNIELIEFIPDWKKFGKKAGFIRNQIIIDNADIVIAFQENNSAGTSHSVNLAKESNKTVYVIEYKRKQ